MLTQELLKNLYINSGGIIRQPRLQLLNFQPSQFNCNEIIVRLSDGKSFIDSPLSGPYKISNGMIISEQLYQTNKVVKKYDIVTIDFFSKIDTNKMCNLQLIIRKIQSLANNNTVIGYPEEISQYVENHNKNIYPFLANPEFNRSLLKMENPQNFGNQAWNNSNSISISNPQGMSNSLSGMNGQINGQKMNESSSKKKGSKGKLQQESIQVGFQNFLDLHQIQNNKDGVFIGRLTRIKSGTRQLKQGGTFITVLYLGFVDLNNNLVRISLVGKNALRELQHLTKYQVYTIKGIQNTTLDRMRFIYYLKLKDKQYTIKKVLQQPYVSALPRYSFNFDHEPAKHISIGQESDIEVVDVLGIIDEIDDKITYKNIHSFQQQRNVIRITIRNVVKSVKVSFWAEQIKMLESCQLKKYDQVLMLDLKKKKNIFLDFTIESNLIKLKDEPQLRQIYAHLLPQLQKLQEPQNIKQILEYFQIQSNKNKVKHIKTYMMKIYQNKVTFKICEQCRKKIQKQDPQCPDCGCPQSLYKFNCLIDFVDYTGSLKCVSFDTTTQKILNKSANQIHEMKQEEVRQHFDKFLYDQYEIGIQCKNDRFVLRSIQKVQDCLIQTKSNLQKIQSFKSDKNFMHLL